MSWAIGYDENWKRDIGYGVPAICDHPGCDAEIDRGLGYVCGSEPYGGEHGCGLFFCGAHMHHRNPRASDRLVANCKRCMTYKLPYSPKPDAAEWAQHKLTHPSWEGWRTENADAVAAIKASAA